MRIGINALYLIPGGVGGTEIYLRNLLPAIAALDTESTFYVFTNRETDPGLVPAAANWMNVRQGLRAAIRPLRLLWEQTILPRESRRLQLDCLLNPGFTAPAVTVCPNVTVFHDLQHKRYPEYFRWFDKPAWDFFLSLSVRRSRILLADSEATRNDLMRYYKLPAERIRVAHLGVEAPFFSIADQRDSLSGNSIEPYLLCASTLHPHKNIERLVRVFARFHEQRPEFRLVLAGMRGFRASAVEAMIPRLGLSDHVQVTGWIPRLRLYELFRNAAAFVYPSTFEGFGLPVTEAMAAGIPLACSDIEPLRSLTAGTAITFDPLSDDALLEALHRVTTDASLVPAARARARQFTWGRCAHTTLEALRSVVSEADLRAESSRPSSRRGT